MISYTSAHDLSFAWFLVKGVEAPRLAFCLMRLMLVMSILLFSFSSVANAAIGASAPDDHFSVHQPLSSGFTMPNPATTCPTSGDLILTNGLSCSLAAGEYTYENVTVQYGGTLTIEGNSLLDKGVTLTAQNVTIEQGGTITASGKGHSGGTGPGKGAPVGLGGSTGGGGHGGWGGDSTSVGGIPNGEVIHPVNLGSGGGNVCAAGGAGGGAIHFIITNTLSNNGAIAANGISGGECWGGTGGGSGGSIWVEAANIAGNGFITANGGDGVISGFGGAYGIGGGGSGGRIAFNTPVNGFTGTIQAFGGKVGKYGGPGTVYWEAENRLAVTDQSSPGASSAVIAGDYAFSKIDLRSRATLTFLGTSSQLTVNTLAGDGTAISLITQGQIVFPPTFLLEHMTIDVQGSYSGANNLRIGSQGRLILHANSPLYIGSCQFDTITVDPAGRLSVIPADNEDAVYTNDSPFHLVANTISIASGGVMESDGTGYKGTSLNGSGPGGGTGNANPSSGYVSGGGGGYGGAGGNGSNGYSGGATYGNRPGPTHLGSAGGAGKAGSSYTGANGGGAIFLEISQRLQIDGILSANGSNGNGTLNQGGSGGGSGGSIWIKTRELTGAGQIQVKGGSSPYGGGGGGGLIAVSAEALNLTTGQMVVDGGTGINSGAPGFATTAPAPDFDASITPDRAIVSPSGSTIFTIRVVNTGTRADTFAVTQSGLTLGWVTFTPPTISLTPGAFADVQMAISITDCQAEQVIPFTVVVHSNMGDQTDSMIAQAELKAPPVLSVDSPEQNSTTGSNSVMFSWHTDPSTTGTLSIYLANQTTPLQTFTTPEGLAHSVLVNNLVGQQAYDWKVSARAKCGTNEATRHFTIGKAIVFTSHDLSFTKDRDYDQRVQVHVQNVDTVAAHTLTASVPNPYDDLIINFVESGSSDQTVTLQPNEERDLTLAIHAQDARQRYYQITAHLIADADTTRPIIDDAVLRITILADGNFSISEKTSAFNPLTLGKTYTITNNGRVITDLSLKAIDDNGLPANVVIQPSLDHARLETDQSIDVVVYPVFGEDDVAQASSSPNTQNQFHLTAFSLDNERASYGMSQGEKSFTLVGSGSGATVNASGSISCPPGKQILEVPIDNVTCSFATSDWYCTNRPNVTTPISIPAFFNQDSLSSAYLKVDFSPHEGVLAHDGKVSINGTNIMSFENTIPTGTYLLPISPESLNAAAGGLATQNIQMNTVHKNKGHYVSSSNYVLGLNVSHAVTYACATSVEEARQAILQTYSCQSSRGFDPLTDIFDGSTLNWGEIKKQVKEVADDKGYQISATNCTQADCGDPINTRTGVFSFASPDLSFPTSAGNLVFQRAYSSGTTASYTDVLGAGWTHNHAARLIFPTDPGGMEGFVLFKDVLGNQYLFGIQPDGTYKAGPGVLAALVKSTASPVTYTLTTPEQAQLTFDPSGRLTARADAQGHSFAYAYDSVGKLTRVSADQGTRYFDLAYNAQGRIVSVTDYTGRHVDYTYDPAGNLATAKDLAGKTWQYAYDASHRMTQVIDPDGKKTVTTEYDMNGRAFRQVDGNGNLMVRIVYNADGSATVYDAQGNAQTHVFNEHNEANQQRDALNRATDTTYDANFRPLTITNAAGHTLTMEWSADGKNMLAKTDPAGNRTEYTYDGLNNLLTEKDPLGNVTRYTYTGKLLTNKTDAGGGTTTYIYTPEGYLETETDANGHTTHYTYDTHGQRLTVTDWLGRVTTNTYDALGRLTDVTDPRGRITHNEYNAAGQLLKTTVNYDPNRPQNAENQYNILTSYEYDTRGNQITVTDTLGHVTRNEYDDADHLVKTTDAAGHATTYTYDAQGRLLTTTDSLNHTTRYAYDAVGRRLTTINALSQSSGTTTFDITANTATASDSAGHSATYYYNTLNQVVKVVDPLGNFTTTTYDKNGNVESRSDALGRTTRYEYDALNRLVKTSDPTGAVTQTIYNAKGQRAATIDALGQRTEYTYDTQGRLTDTKDVLGHHITNAYDDDGNLIATTDVLGHTTHSEYDAWGRQTAMVDAANRRTTYTYDALDRVISTTDPTGTATTTYDALGRVTARTDVYGRTSTTGYDALGRALTVTDFGGNTTTNAYDAVGNLISTTDALGHTTTYEYDALNRKVKTTDALGHTSQVAYDTLGNQTDETDANGVVTHTEYDALNRPAAVIQNYRPPLQADAATNVRIAYTYNAVGNRTQVQDANGVVTHTEYDTLNRVTAKIDPLGNTWQSTYDLAGRLTVQVDGNNQTTTYSYDAAGHVTLIDYPDGEADVSSTYNAAGQPLTMTDGQGTTTWAYDDLGRLTSVTHPDGGKVAYTYDAFGRRQTVTTHVDANDLTGKTVTYAYDEDGRLSAVTDWQSHTTQYTYDALGRVQSLELPNGITSTYTYDEVGRLTDLAHRQGLVDLAVYHYAYDAVGNRVGASENVTGIPTTPPTQLTVQEQGFMAISLAWPDSSIAETGYRLERSTDNQQHWQRIADLPANTLRYVDEGLARHTRYWYRLTPYNGQGDGPAQTVETETGMQPVTYPTGEPKLVSITYAYDALKRLKGASYDTGTAFGYTYDAAGNTLQREQTIAGQTSTTVYTYDTANQLATAQEGSGTAWQYHYDGNGSLVEQTPGSQAGNGAKRYSYNTTGQLTKVETHDGTSYQPQAEMAYDGQGQRLALTAYQGEVSLTSRYLLDGGTTLAATANGQTTYYLSGVGEFQADWRYYLADGTNTARQITDPQGQVMGTRSYTPWGEVLDQSGQADLTAGYLGGMLDAATGLIYMGNGQYYDPKTGRFLTRNANPNQTNPYVPWQSDPVGAMLAPLALLAMVYGRKKQRGKWDNMVIVVVLCLAAGVGLSACSGSTTTTAETSLATAVVTTTPMPNGTIEASATVTPKLPTATSSPSVTPTITCAGTMTPTPTTTETPTPVQTPAFSDFGLKFEGSWNEDLKKFVMEAISAVGEKLSAFTGGISKAEAFKTVYGSPFIFTRSNDGAICQGGYLVVACNNSAPIDTRLLVHELGHSLQASIDGVSARQPTPTPAVGTYWDLEKAAIQDDEGNWVTGTHPDTKIFERTTRGYKGEREPWMYHGKQFTDWDSNDGHTASMEDFADMYMNWVFNTFDYSAEAKGAGTNRFNWVQDNMSSWIALATR